MSGRSFGRALNAVLVVVLAVSLLATAYVAVNPLPTTNAYSEFYLLGPDGKAAGYPTELDPGESGTVIVGVTNHEGESTDYVVRLVDLNATNDSSLATASRSVPHDETWETSVTFSIDEPGRHHVQFRLYKGTTSGEPYLTTRLWVNVTAAAVSPAEQSPTGVAT